MIVEEYAMFEYIYLKNYKSFGEVRFDLTDKQGNPKKMILIYGENGIGKSNLASAFFMLSETLRTMDVRDIMQSFLSERPDAINEEDFSRLIRLRYKDLETLIRENKMVASDKPMLLEVGFRLNNRSGRYLIETDDNQLIHERLEYVLTKNKGTYFDITPDKMSISTKIFQDRSSYNEIKSACNKFWGKHTLLSILMHESDDKANEYIKEQISDNFETVLSFFTRMSCKIKFGSYQERGGICLPHEIFGDFDEGNISLKDEDLLDKTESMLNIFFKSAYRDVKKVFYKRVKKETSIHYQLMQTKTIACKDRDIEFSMESTGTQYLLQLLPYMLVVVDGSVAVIDEFDTGVHDLLVKKLVQSLFNTLTGQLIMTTHSTLLMEAKIPKECIYVINELEDGSKEIEPISHYDQKIHENTNIRNQYLKGVYKGIPAPDDIDFTTLLSELGI